MGTFSASVDEWVKESTERLIAVRNDAVQTTFNQILDRWPVDTGFSKASFTASLSGFAPLAANTGIAPQTTDFSLILLNADLDDAIFANFIAVYAIHIEFGSNGRPGRGIVRMAAQMWQANVNRSAARLRGP